jgi:hypothetical protein
MALSLVRNTTRAKPQCASAAYVVLWVSRPARISVKTKTPCSRRISIMDILKASSGTHKDGAQHPRHSANEEESQNRSPGSTSCRTNGGNGHVGNSPEPAPVEAPVIVVPGRGTGAIELCSKSAKQLQSCTSTYVCQETKCY